MPKKKNGGNNKVVKKQEKKKTTGKVVNTKSKVDVKTPKKKNKLIRIAGLLALFVFIFGTSYALFKVTLNGTLKNLVSSGRFDLRLLDEDGMQIYSTDNSYQNSIDYGISIENAVPITDAEGEETEGTKFSLKNYGSLDTDYKITLEDLPLPSGEERLDDKYVKYTLTVNYNGEYERYDGLILISMLNDREIDSGIIKPGEQYDYTLRIWVDKSAEGDLDSMGKLFLTHLKVDASQVTKDSLANIDQKYMFTNNYGSVLSTLRQDGTFTVDKTTFTTNRAVTSTSLLRDTFDVYFWKLAYESVVGDVSKLDTANKIVNTVNDWYENASVEDTNAFDHKVEEELSYYVLKKNGFDVTKSNAVSMVSDIINKATESDDWTDLTDAEIAVLGAETILDSTNSNSNNMIHKYIMKPMNGVVSSFPVYLCELEIKPGVTQIRGFSGAALTKVVIPEGVTSIYQTTFRNNDRLREVSLPSTLTSIGNYAFDKDTHISEITIPNSVTSVGMYAFRGWTSDQTIHIDNAEGNISWNTNWHKNSNAVVDYMR